MLWIWGCFLTVFIDWCLDVTLYCGVYLLLVVLIGVGLFICAIGVLFCWVCFGVLGLWLGFGVNCLGWVFAFGFLDLGFGYLGRVCVLDLFDLMGALGFAVLRGGII